MKVVLFDGDCINCVYFGISLFGFCLILLLLSIKKLFVLGRMNMDKPRAADNVELLDQELETSLGVVLWSGSKRGL